MTELQMGLIGFGAFAVLGVLAYNKWQESKHRKIAERMISGQHADVLLDESDANEVFDASGERLASSYEAIDTLDTSLNPVTMVTRVGGKRVEPALRVDPHIEEIVPKAAPDTVADPVLKVLAQTLSETLPVTLAEMLPEAAPEKTRPIAQTLSPSVRDARVAAESVAATVSPKPESVNARVIDGVSDTRKARDSIEASFPLHFLSPLIDYVACFEAIEAASAHQILESQRDFLVRVRKPIHWLGYNEHRHEWEIMVDDGKTEYRRLCIALQLVDRSGPLHEGDLSVFHLAMQDLAEELMAVVDLPPRESVLEMAAQLDSFSAGVDIQIGLNVISQSQLFAGTKLRALAEAAGMTFDAEGNFVRHDDEGNVLYRLSNQADPGFSADSVKTISTHGVTFLLDVPRVAHGDRVFNQMLDLARRFAEALQGSLVDDNRRRLSEGELEPIRRQLAEYQAAMAARNLPAGGHLALRLFS